MTALAEGGESMGMDMKEIILKQLQLLQDACDRDMAPEEAAEVSGALASALTTVMHLTPDGPIGL